MAAIDTLRLARRLAGPGGMAKEAAEALDEALRVTKSDITELRERLKFQQWEVGLMLALQLLVIGKLGGWRSRLRAARTRQRGRSHPVGQFVPRARNPVPLR